MEFKELAPTTTIISRPIRDEEGDSMVYLSLVEYENAIQASIYDKKPKLGSMTMAYPVMDSVERHSIFTGKKDQLSAALAMILVRATNKIVYGSVNIREHATVTTQLIKDMISEYTETLIAKEVGEQHLQDKIDSREIR